MNKKQHIAIFGAGKYGKELLESLLHDDVVCFIDNDIAKQEAGIDGIPVVGVREFAEKYNDCKVLISSRKYMSEIVRQLENNGIFDWDYYPPVFKSYYSEDKLIFDRYETENAEMTEKELNDSQIGHPYYRWLIKYTKRIYEKQPLFEHVEIETYNRCNGVCSFCPVSVGNDSRIEKKMSKELFYKIVDELAELDYRGRIALFSNNEPLLDDRILDFHEYAKNKLNMARFHLYTNGTLLTLELFKDLMQYVDELIIDNYSQERKLIPTVVRIKDYCLNHKELIKKVSIVIRKPNEILTTRGGAAPNRYEKVSYDYAGCCFPFKQIIIRPDGKVSLCCNDPLGKKTLGDVSKESIYDVWYGESFDNIRKKLLMGRQYIELCKYCDVFSN